MQTVLFEAHHLYYLPNFIPIMAEMRQRGSYRIAASIPATRPMNEQDAFYRACADRGIEGLREADEDSRLNSLKSRAFDIIVVGNIGKLDSIAVENSFAVMVYHGIGLKQTYYRDISDRIDLRAVESVQRLELLAAQGFGNLALTGFTKLDPLERYSGQRRSGLEKLGLDPGRKTVLYAPSFYPTAQKSLLPVLVEGLADCNILIKLHGFSWYQRRYRSQSERAGDLAEIHPNVYLANPDVYDITPLYGLSDLLVSDISSTLFEYLAMNRPIILTDYYDLRLKHRILKWRFNRKLDLKRLAGIDFAVRTRSPEETIAAIRGSLENPDQLESQRRQAAETYLYRSDGQSSRRLVDAIEAKLKARR